jgi:hypothetical protein
MSEEKPKLGLELVRDIARNSQSGVVFDRKSVETEVPKTIELLGHLPEPLQTAIKSGESTIVVDFMGNLSISGFRGES